MAKTAKKAKLDPNGLTVLGLEKLIGIVLDEAALNPSFKKRLNAALAGIGGGAAAAKVIDSRLSMLEKSRTRIRWQKEKAFGNDLESISASIVKEFGAVDPGMALERLIRFVLGYDSIAERVNDSSGRIAGIYAQACDAAAGLAAATSAEQRAQLPALLTPGLQGTDYYGFRTLLAVRIATALAPDVLKTWDEALAAMMNMPAGTTILPAVVHVRRAIADARGDIDTYVAIEDALPENLREPLVVAEKLLEAGRHADALIWVRQPRKSRVGFVRRVDLLSGGLKPPPNRETLEAAILEGLKDRAAAQSLRWKAFEQRLDVNMLRDYIAKAGDFEEFEALDKAFAFVDSHKDILAALHFYLSWPRLDLAARFVLAHGGRWQNEFDEVLLAAAEALQDEHPAAATLLYRTLVDCIVGGGLLSAYGDAAVYFSRLSALAARPGGNEGLMPHGAYVAGLREKHARRYGFWEQVPAELYRSQ